MNSQHKDKQWYKRPWIIAVCAVVFIFVLISLVPLGGKDSNALSINAGTINSNNSLTTSTTTSGNDESFLAADRILVLNRSDHRVMRAVAAKLIGRLEALDFVEQVDLCRPGEGPSPGEPLHDFYIVLEMPSFKSKGLLATGRTVTAKVRITCGRHLFDSRHGYTDNYSPPFARLQMESKLEHESVSQGYESAGARYTQVIDEIEKQIGGALEKNLNQWAQNYALPESMPVSLNPPYRSVPEDLPLPANESTELVLSGNGPMLHNRTVWTLETSEPFEVLKEWHDRITRQQWHVDPKQFNERKYQYFIRATQGEELYEAFEVREGYGPRKDGERVRLVFRYSARMDREELNPVYEAMVADEDLPVTVGLAFFHRMSAAQRKLLVESWMARDKLPFGAEFKIVHHLHGVGLKNEAQRRLRRLYLAALFEDDDKMKELEKLGREILEDENWAPSPPTLSELKAHGVMQCLSNAVSVVALNEHATFLLGTENGAEKQNLLDVVVRPSAIPEGLYTLEMRTRAGPDFAHQGTSMSSTPHSHAHPWKGSSSMSDSDWHWQAEAVEIGTNRFNISITLH